jgi:hypothetical protein
MDKRADRVAEISLELRDEILLTGMKIFYINTRKPGYTQDVFAIGL